jgi:hypothetical protein
VIPVRADFGEVIAETTFLFEMPGGEEKRVRIKLGRPYIEEHEGEPTWACPCELEGLEPRYADARGEDSYQALFLAEYLIRKRLAAFLAKGGKILMPDSREELSQADLDSFFGTFEP